MALEGCDFIESCHRIAALCSFQPSHTLWRQGDGVHKSLQSIAEDWADRPAPWSGSATWRYLRWNRCLPAFIIRTAINQDLLREGPCGSMWAAHTDDDGTISGWEGRGPEWRGFATGGSKILFRFGASQASRLCVTEAAIDAMSLAALDGVRDGTLYLSTGGGWAPATVAAVRRLAAAPDTQLVAATDGNPQGDCQSAWRSSTPLIHGWGHHSGLRQQHPLFSFTHCFGPGRTGGQSLADIC
nr:DUF3991 and TOPRIM domain-containing protein [Peteryoungia desertarenae]